jgi:hypothetical protein
LILHNDRYTQLDIDWQNARDKHLNGDPVHMKDFGKIVGKFFGPSR